MATGTVRITSSADVKAITRANQRLQSDFKRTKEEVRKTKTTVADLGTALKAIAGAAVLERVVTGLGSLVDQTLRARLEIKSLADQSNVSAKLFGSLAQSARAANVSADQLAGSLKALTAKAYEASQGGASAQAEFAALGISAEDLAGPSGSMRSTEEVFRLVLAQLGAMPDQTQRAAAAQKLLGEGAGGLTAALGELSTKGLQRAEERAAAFTRQLEGPGLEAAQNYQVQMQKLDLIQRSVGDLFAGMATSILPALTDGLVYVSVLISDTVIGTFHDFITTVQMAGSGLAGLAEAFIRYSTLDFQGAVDAISDTGTELERLRAEAGLSLNPLQALADNVSGAHDAAVEMVRKVREASGETADLGTNSTEAAEGLQAMLDQLEEAAEKAKKAEQEQTKLNRAVKDGQQVYADYTSGGLVPHGLAMQLFSGEIADRVQAQLTLQQVLAENAEIEAQLAAEAEARAARQSEIRQGAIGLISQTADVVGDLAGLFIDAGTASDQMTQKQKKAARTAFAVQKAAALAQAIVATAVSIAQTLNPSVGGPPPLNFITAGLVGAAGAVQIAKIASQQPAFALGGVMPASGAPALLHPGEGVLSQGAVDAMGGRGGLAAQNARSGTGAGGPAVVVQWKHLRQSFRAEVTDAGRGTGPMREIRRDGRRAGQRRYQMRQHYGAL